MINKLGQNPLSGDIFIFINRTRTLVKILVWDQTGFAAGANREVIENGAVMMGRDLNFIIGETIAGMKTVAAAIGLAGD